MSRERAALKLTEIVNLVVRDSQNPDVWQRLFLFASRCLCAPPRGGVHRSLANFVNDPMNNEADPSPISKLRAARKPTDPLSRLAAHVAQKTEEGDFKGAVRIASSDDKVAPLL